MVKYNSLTIVIFALILALPACLCMYEDEIGLVDWHQAHIGRINTAFFVPPRQVVVATDSNVLAALNIKTGEIMWRQVLPQGVTIDKIRFTEQDILVVSGKTISVWSISEGGVLRWEEEEEKEIVDVQINEQVVSVATTSSLSLRRIVSGESIFSSPSFSPSATIIISGTLYSVSLKDNSLQVSSIVIKPPYTLSSPSSVSLPSKGQSLIITPEGYVVVLGGESGKYSLFTYSLKSSRAVLSQSLDASITKATLRKVGEDSFVVQTPSSEILFRPAESSSFPFSSTTLPAGTQVAVSGTQVAHASPSSLSFSNSTGKFQSSLSSSVSPVSPSLFFLSPSPYLLIVGGDWRASVLSLNSFFSSSSFLWEREEALAGIVKTEIIELPPDVTELNDLVREFEGDDKSDWFVSRILAQIDQIKHSILSLINGIPATIVSSKPLTAKELVTKDKFGFRKLIIAVTESGKIFGLSTDRGQIVWGTTVRPSGFSKNTFVYVTRTSSAYPPEIVVGDTNTIYKLNPVDGELQSTTPTPNLVQAIMLPFLYTQTGTATHSANTHVIMLVHSQKSSVSVSLFPDNKETNAIFQKEHDKISFFLIDKSESVVTGYYFPEKDMKRAVSWNVSFTNEKISGIVSHLPHDKVYHPAAVLGDRNILPKYLNRNMIAIATVSSTTPELHIYLLDCVTGGIIYHTVHSDCVAVNAHVPLVLMENSLVYSYWNTKTHKHQMSVVDLYTKGIDWNNVHFSSFTAPPPVSLSLSFFLPTHVQLLSHTSSARGITAKHLLLGLASGAVVSLDKRWADARRPLPQNMRQEDKEENLIPYHPRLAFPPQAYVTYNQTVARMKQIVTTGASLESTTLVLTVGLDLFFTRLSPAEAYDILTSDFNYPMLILTITVLCVATVVTSKMSRRKDTLKAWK